MTRSAAALFSALLVTGGLLPAARPTAEPPAPIGRRVTDFTLPDTATGKPWAFADASRDSKASVVVFVTTGCPVSTASAPKLAELHKKYAPKGVTFAAVGSSDLDTPADLAAFAKAAGITFPVLKDAGTATADRFAVDRVPTAFVLDAARTVRYAGRIDDQFAPGVHRPKPTTRDLADALDAVLAGKEVATPFAAPAGCKLTREAKAVAAAEVTYHRDVAPIVQAKCVGCHRPGEAGPFALTSYKQAKGWAGMIREVVADGQMPPWHADAQPGHFRNDRRLTDAQKKTLLSWIDAGCPEGDPKDAPPPAAFVNGWRLSREPDQVFRMNRAIDVPASSFLGLGVPYSYVPAGEEFTEDKWVTGAEIRPEYRAVVHHVIAFILPPRDQRKKLDLNNFGDYLLAAYVPGDEPYVLPEGFAKKIPKGSQLLFEVHYTPNGKAGSDRSVIGLTYAKGPPKHEVKTKAIKYQRFSIPPGDPNYEVKAAFTPGKAISVLAYSPHMHVRGKAFRFDAEYPGGKEEKLLNVPRYDFNWQVGYIPATPTKLPAGTTVRCTAWYDNSAGNPANPDPTARVRWGNQTWDEMMIGFIEYYEE